jgi:prevent-host-death family protein
MHGQAGVSINPCQYCIFYVSYILNVTVDGVAMLRISSGELQRRIGSVQDTALTQPVTITNNGRDRLVMMSAAEYRRLKRRDRQVLGLEDFTEADLEALRRVQPSTAAAAFDHELND